MQTSFDQKYDQISVPRYNGMIHFKFDFEGESQKMSADEFWNFCLQNRDLKVELTKEGEVIIMPPTGFDTSDKNAVIVMQLAVWAKSEKTGRVTDSSGAFVLPNGAVYAPDAAWTANGRLERFTADELKRFLPISPDFVIELRSESDSLSALRLKMVEYVENGSRLGWLINPHDKQVEIYRPGRAAEVLSQPQMISGEDVLVNFQLDLTEIW